MNELKPCPFCGGVDIHWDEEAHAMYCLDCNCEGPEAQVGTEDSALAAWNARASSPDPAREALVGALKEVAQLLGGWREAIAELEDFCSEPVRLKNMTAALDQIDDLAPKIRAALAEQGHK